MKKNFKLFALFLLILLALVCIIQYVLDLCYQKRVTQKFTKIFSHRIDAEIMLFGSSTTYHGFDPLIIDSITGNSAYNMGWDGLFFIQSAPLIKEYLSYETQCKYIVIGCDVETLGKNKLITRPDLFFAYLGNNYVYSSLHKIEPEKIFKAKYIPGYALTLLNKSFYCDILFARPDADTLFGYDPVSKPFDVKQDPQPFEGSYETQIYSELKTCIGEITEKGIKVVLVMTPIYTEGNKKVLNLALLKSKYSALASKDVYFIDYTTDTMCRSKEYFSNYSHLSKTGAALFSTTFSHDLLNIIRE
jgi:hypothetical protein